MAKKNNGLKGLNPHQLERWKVLSDATYSTGGEFRPPDPIHVVLQNGYEVKGYITDVDDVGGLTIQLLSEEERLERNKAEGLIYVDLRAVAVMEW